MNKRLLTLIGIILLIVVFVIAIPLSFEYSLGDETLPDSALYEIERIGESIKCGVTFGDKNCLLDLADERDLEATELQKIRNTLFDAGERERYEFMIVATQNAAARLRIEALGE